MSLINPEHDLKHILLNVSMPGRYVGGEFGITKTYNKNSFKFGICFPDLYEIGMSNQAIKLLYRGLNNIEGINCERVFAPAQDFEEKLKSSNIPLYTLENGIPLKDLDILGFSIGYELSASNILSILDTGQIPILKQNRSDTDPIVIAGGPAITNPIPFGNFLDAVYLGEAEEDFFALMEEISKAKKRGADRQSILEILSLSPYIWTDSKTEPIKRSIWHGFNSKVSGLIPVSSISTVQDNGIIEIMRGCPNSCRFCHAASYYRPYRQKNISNIIEEVNFLVNKCGYNELTLSSLSSGDYEDLSFLIQRLNLEHEKSNISFSLPSLRINSFTLPLLKELSKVRRSGLTFAIETPEEEWRRSINKEIDPEKIIKILKEAKGMGWKLAKFYFMIGLPGTDRLTEANKISYYIEEIQKNTGMKLNVNVGTFIPKPHTPFQWSAQLTEQESYHDMRELKNHFKRNPNVKLSYHSPFVSFVEGIISRGDKRVGDIILNAYNDGARLDAWDEHFNMPIWQKAIDNADWNVEEEISREKSIDEPLPWDSITLGITKKYLKREYLKALNYETTDICDDPCNHNCGVCKDDTVVGKPENIKELLDIPTKTLEENSDTEEAYTFLIEFSKTGKAIYLSHLNMVNVFSKSFRRSGVLIKYTQGFNPKPKMEFAHPLSLGIKSKVEILSITLSSKIETEELLSRLNDNLPSGVSVSRCELLISKVSNRKKKSLMSLYGGSSYLISSLSNNDIKLYEQLKEYDKENNDFPNVNINTKNDIFHLEISNTGKKDSNIFFHIDKMIERSMFYENYNLERINLFAGTDGRNYFDFLIN